MYTPRDSSLLSETGTGCKPIAGLAVPIAGSVKRSTCTTWAIERRKARRSPAL
ncbi:MAG: hypothetical protein KF753_10705 [Caldilineaceae bacterium]|nr:hypothetical protein [Caldilineaceae bacterium]